jgi:hypothetical protein
MAPNWVIGHGTKTIARLVADGRRKRFDFEIETNVSAAELLAAANAGTAKDSDLVCPNPDCKKRTPIKVIRGDGRGIFGENKSLLRPWENSDLAPRADDIFGERLYCVRWVDTWTEVDTRGVEKVYSERHYRAPSESDLIREKQVFDLLADRFDDWQRKGFIPSRRIEPGIETTRLYRERGWTHWHHLFAPRQLLVNGLLAENVASLAAPLVAKVASTLAIGRCADWNARLSRWHPAVGNEKSEQVFSNQALNTLWNYGVRPLTALDTTWFARIATATVFGKSVVSVRDARTIDTTCDIWITDPPYADAVSHVPPAEPEACRLLAPQRGQLANALNSPRTDNERFFLIG